MKDPNRKSNVNNFQATSTSCSSIVPLSPGRLFPLRKILQCRPWKITIKDPNRKSNIRILDDKYRGYRSLSTFLDSDENFMLYRRFGYLHSRLLLRKQDKLRKLEAELDEFDEEDANGTLQQRRLLMSRDCDEAADRREPEGTRTRTMILDDIEENLAKYDEWILKAQKMVALNRPAARDFKSVEAYIFDKKPLVDEECGFIYQQEDLITLRDGREMALLDSFTEKMLQLFHCSLLQSIFCSKADRQKTNDPNLHYYSKDRKDYFTTALLTLVLLCLLILPVFIMYRFTVLNNLDATYTSSIGLLLIFTLVFSAVLSLFTQAKRHEIFGAAAAYCAVLVVFISNIPGAK